MKGLGLGVVVGLVWAATSLWSGVARAHTFERFSQNGCCSETMEDCTARPEHSDERCQVGHKAVSLTSHFWDDPIGCFGVGCVGGGGECHPDIPSGSVAETANGLDDDCDGYIDDEQCDNVDNDGDNSVDEDIGSCLMRVAVVPLCYFGNDGNFEDSWGHQIRAFVERAGLDQCSDNIGIEIIPPSQVNISCDNAGAACDGKFEGLQQGVVDGGVDLSQFDFVYMLTNYADFCDNDILGFSNGSDMIWGSVLNHYNFAHETGHLLGLGDEYCSRMAGDPDDDPVDERCNTGSPPAPPPPNFLGSDLGCEPREGDCCEDCEGYEQCCEGNKEFGQNCIMSYADDEVQHGYCARCRDHLLNPPSVRSEADPSGQAPLSCDFAHLGNTPMMRASLTYRQDGTFQVTSASVGVGRLGLAPRRDHGSKLFEVSAHDGTPLFATHVNTYFTSADPKRKGVDYSGLFRDEAAVAVRAPLPAGTTDLSVLVLRSTSDGQVVQTTLNGVPPIANAGLDQVVECEEAQSALVAMNATGSSDPDGDTLRYEWFGNAMFSDTRSATPSALLQLGTHELFVVVSDGADESAPDSVLYTVQDTTAPQLETLSPIALASCGNEQSFTFTPPSAVDSCSPNVTVTGRVVEKNGAAITPIPLSSGAVVLSPADYRIEWQAQDEVGNSSTTTQLVTVRPGLQAQGSLVLRDRAKVFAAPGVPGPAANSGNGLLELGVEARSGSLFSKGAVTLRNRSFVGGNIVASGSVNKAASATVTGTTSAMTTVTLPSLPSLAAFAGGSGHTVVNSGQQLTLPAGAHGAMIVNSGSTLRLEAGDHRFTTLTVNSSATLLVAAGARVFVAGPVALRSPFLLDGQSSTLANIFLGLSTSGNVHIETVFEGTLLAPQASVSFGIGSGATYRGLFFARNIELRPDTIVQCLASPVPQ